MLMSRKKFRKLNETNVELAWELFGRDAVSLFAGESAIPIPFFTYSKCPCAPGFVILSKQRSFQSLVKMKPPECVFTECLWDFYPRWATNQKNSGNRIMKNRTLIEDDDSHFLFETTRTEKGETKTVRMKFKGKHFSKLDVSPKDLISTVVETELLEDTYFHDNYLYLVDQVYAVDEIRIEVWIDEDVDVMKIESRYPLAFSLYRLRIDWNEFIHYVKHVQIVNAEKFMARWLDRQHYKLIFHNFIPNQRKYGGESGDVLGPQNRPFFLGESAEND